MYEDLTFLFPTSLYFILTITFTHYHSYCCVSWSCDYHMTITWSSTSYSGNVVYIVNHGLGDKLLVTATDNRLTTPTTTETTPTHVKWEEAAEIEKSSGVRVRIHHDKVFSILSSPYNQYTCLPTHTQPVKEVVWHSKGDYLATLLVEGNSFFHNNNMCSVLYILIIESSTCIVIHQLSKRSSQV